MGVMSIREEAKARRRGRILRAAVDILARDGPAALSTGRIAERAGVSVATLYNLIGKKDDILLLLITDTIATLESRLAPFTDADPLTQLEAICSDLVHFSGRTSSLSAAASAKNTRNSFLT